MIPFGFSQKRANLRRVGVIWSLLMVGLFVAAGHVSAAAAAAAPSPSLLISEVYAPALTAGGANAQWFELYNPTQYRYPLRGLQLGNSKVIVPINSDVVLEPGNSSAPPPSSFAVVVSSRAAFLAANPAEPTTINIVEAPELFPLETQTDALLLYTPDASIVIDQVNWGTADKSWPNYNAEMWQQGLRALSTNETGKSWGRTPANRDSNTAADWTIHSTLSPGGGVDPVSQTPFQGAVTNIAGALGSFLLWLAFIVIGLLAYHFERTRDTRTYWQLLLLAPSGLLFYTIVNVLAFRNNGQLSDQEKWIAFPVLAVSAVLCLVGMYLFRNKAITLLEGR